MKGKRGQQDVIVTVILVLVAIAAVAFVAVFIMNQVKKTTGGADDTANCAKIDVEIVKATAPDSKITIRRNTGTTGGDDIELGNAIVIVQGTKQSVDATAIIPEMLETGDIPLSAPLVANNVVELAVTLKDGFTCGVKDTKVVA